MDTHFASSQVHEAAVVWLDQRHALVARAYDGHAVITEVERAADLETRYLLRIVHEADGCDRVVVMGADRSRIAFEREFVALFQRPDRLIDVGPSPVPVRHELIDHLRVLQPTLS